MCGMNLREEGRRRRYLPWCLVSSFSAEASAFFRLIPSHSRLLLLHCIRNLFLAGLSYLSLSLVLLTDNWSCVATRKHR